MQTNHPQELRVLEIWRWINTSKLRLFCEFCVYSKHFPPFLSACWSFLKPCTSVWWYFGCSKFEWHFKGTLHFWAFLEKCSVYISLFLAVAGLDVCSSLFFFFLGSQCLACHVQFSNRRIIRLSVRRQGKSRGDVNTAPRKPQREETAWMEQLNSTWSINMSDRRSLPVSDEQPTTARQSFTKSNTSGANTHNSPFQAVVKMLTRSETDSCGQLCLNAKYRFEGKNFIISLDKTAN